MRWKLAALAIAITSMCACTEDHRATGATYHAMSNRFDLCVRLPEHATYQLLTQGIDFDVGRLVISGTEVKVYVTQNPAFSGKVWTKGPAVTKGFEYIGKENQQGVEKILLGHKRYARRGPLFVLFIGPDLSTVEPVLAKKGFVADCQIKGSNPREKWREEPQSS